MLTNVMGCEIKFLPSRPMRTKISITNSWPASMEEMQRMYNRDLRTFNSFFILEMNPNYELRFPLDKDDFDDFLIGLRRCRDNLQDLFDHFAYQISEVVEKIERINKDE
jgi:hypothetical protein